MQIHANEVGTRNPFPALTHAYLATEVGMHDRDWDLPNVPPERDDLGAEYGEDFLLPLPLLCGDGPGTLGTIPPPMCAARFGVLGGRGSLACAEDRAG